MLSMTIIIIYFNSLQFYEDLKVHMRHYCKLIMEHNSHHEEKQWTKKVSLILNQCSKFWVSVLTTDCSVCIWERTVTSVHHCVTKSKALTAHCRHEAPWTMLDGWGAEGKSPKHTAMDENSSSSCQHTQTAKLSLYPATPWSSCGNLLHKCAESLHDFSSEANKMTCSCDKNVPDSLLGCLRKGDAAEGRRGEGRAGRTAAGWTRWTVGTTHSRSAGEGKQRERLINNSPTARW